MVFFPFDSLTFTEATGHTQKTAGIRLKGRAAIRTRVLCGPTGRFDAGQVLCDTLVCHGCSGLPENGFIYQRHRHGPGQTIGAASDFDRAAAFGKSPLTSRAPDFLQGADELIVDPVPGAGYSWPGPPGPWHWETDPAMVKSPKLWMWY